MKKMIKTIKLFSGVKICAFFKKAESAIGRGEQCHRAMLFQKEPLDNEELEFSRRNRPYQIPLYNRAKMT